MILPNEKEADVSHKIMEDILKEQRERQFSYKRNREKVSPMISYV